MMKSLYFMGILTIASVMLLSLGLAVGEEIVLEAELANEISPPMVIAVPADADAAGGTAPDEPSNGQFVWAPDKPVNGGPNGDRGWVKFIINIVDDGTYAIWANVVAWDGNSDSFWTTWQPVDTNENPQQTQNMDYRWSIGNGAAWHWDRVEAWKADDSHEDRVWDLPVGETILTIWTREDGSMLDSLYITDDIAAGSVNRRVPDDDDRQLQIEGVLQAVEAEGKLPITWGYIRSYY